MEYIHENGAVYYGHWLDDTQFGIGYEIWYDSSTYYGNYNNGKKDGIGTYLWQDKTMYQYNYSFYFKINKINSLK